jgi:PKD repeat protein
MNKKTFLFITIFVASGVINVLMQSLINASPTLSIDVATNKQSYHLRENVIIYGNLTSDGSPISNGLVAIEVLDPLFDAVIAYRTLTTGNVTTVDSPIQIVEVVPCDSNYSKRVDNITIRPRPYVTWAYFKVRVRNTDTVSHAALMTVCLYDGNQIWLGAGRSQSQISPGESEAWFPMEIPYWAYTGEAKAIGNAYTDRPKAGGISYCLETSASLQINRGEGGGATGLGTKSHENPIVGVSEIDGTYNAAFKLSSEPIPGTYVVYTSARRADTLLLEAQESTTFEVETASSPPQASFTYSPLQPYVNQTVTFDASASTAEGYDDTIVSYEWNFGDGTPPDVKTTPTVSHTFTQVQTYIVTLNVTDSEGLWCTTSKPVTTLPPTGPTADFIWVPAPPSPNQTVTFDASSSTPGWNGTGYPPIVSYQWDLGDGNITTVGVPTINHVYILEGNYSVTLTVTDSGGLQDTKAQTVRVTTAPGLIGDVNGDGKVDIKDLVLLIKAFGSFPGEPNWNPNADVNTDGKVDIKDLVLLIKHFGEHI